jgi:predicted transcriptional regulator
MEARDYVNELRHWGLTQAQIAERTGIPQPTISKIARGEVEDVLSKTYRRLQTVHTEESHRRPGADGVHPPYADLPLAAQRHIIGGA